MRRDNDEKNVTVESYRHNTIQLNTKTSKFTVKEVLEIEPVDTVQAARNAIDRHIKASNAGVRRKVLFLKGQDYYNAEDDEPRKLVRGELTSWTQNRGYRNTVEGIVMVDGDRDTISPDDLFEDTPENVAALKELIEHDKMRIAKAAEARAMLAKIPHVELPKHLKKKAIDE